MEKNREFNNILDECLERLLTRGETVEQCLRDYPQQAAELEPLLRTVLATKGASVIQPHPEFRAKARDQFHSALQEIEQKKRLPFFGWQPRWAMAVAIVLALLLAGGGTVAAASNSMPDNPLYPVKLATEQAQLALTPSALGKAELYAKLADKRVAEIIYVANKGKPEQMEKVTQRLNSCLARVAVLATTQKEEAGVLMAPPPQAPAPSEQAKEEAGAILAPAPREAPAPAPAAEEALVVEEAPSEQARGRKDVSVQANGRAKLRTHLTNHAINHPARLRAVLETAPESAKPALRRAIAASVAGYEKALEALD
ncbi:DUF5667 domain-containing protein [Chloroflexota bacterium]